GLGEPRRLDQVVREIDRLSRVVLGQDVSGTRVNRLPPRSNDLLVDRLLRERVAPRVAAWPRGVFLDQLLRDRRLEGTVNGRLRSAGDLEQDRMVEAPAECSGGLEHPGLLRLQPPDP